MTEAEASSRGRASSVLSRFPTVTAAEVPWISVDEMRAIDRVMVDELGIALEQMMENAGRSLSGLARALLAGSAADRSIVVLAGTGGNGGGGLAAARHLANAGARVRVLLGAERGRLAPVTRLQLETLETMGVPVAVTGDDAGLDEPELVIDALLGYSQSGAPREGAARLIADSRGFRVLALDVPSGLELTTGELHSPHVRAEATLTLAAPKTGLRVPGAASVLGELFLADISVPAAAFSRIDREWRTPFGAGPLVRIV